MKISFYLDNRPTKKGECRIMCRYSNSSETGELPWRFPVKINGAQLSVHPDVWIKSEDELLGGIKKRRYSKRDSFQRVELRHSRGSAINTLLDKFEAELRKVHDKLLEEGKGALPSEVKEVFYKPKKSLLFWAAFDEFVAWKSMGVKGVTLKNYSSSLRHTLQEYEKKKGKLSFYKMTKDFPRKYINCLQGKEISYLAINISRLRTFLRYAYEKGHIKSRDFENKSWDIKGKKAIRAALTLDDIESLYKLEEDRYTPYIDRLLFHFWTGTRIGETQRVVKLDGNILYFYKGKQKKDRETIYQVYLIPPARAIWDKYQGIPVLGKRSSDISSKLSTRLKYVDRFKKEVNTTKGLRALYTNITSHTGRISLVTNMRDVGIDRGNVKQVVGHSSGRDMTDHYDKASIDRAFRTIQEFWEIVKDRFEGYL